MVKEKEVKYLLKKTVTLKSLRVLDKHGLALREPTTDQQMANKIITICLSEESIREVLAAVFDDDFSSVDIEEIDLSQVTSGVQSFLKKLLQPNKS